MKQTVIALAIAIVLMAFVLAWIPRGELMEILATTSLPRFGVCVVLMGLIYLARSMKLDLAVPERRMGVSRLYPIVAIHAFLKNTLPFRLGELTLIYFIQRRAGVSLVRAGMVLYVALASDLIALFILGTAALFIAAHGSDHARFLSLALPCLAITIVGLAAYFMARAVLGRVAGIFRGRTTSRWPGKVVDACDTLGAALDAYSPGKLAAFLGYSMATWSLRFIILTIMVPSWGFPLDLQSMTIATSIAALLGALPVQGLAGFGTMEASWAIGFAAVDLDSTRALTASVLTHLFILSLMFIHFAIGLVLYRMQGEALRLTHTAPDNPAPGDTAPADPAS
ncbi:MAG: flippase-like domain-containing protein [Deltaproteobacteria bacterium]|nr:flippase-like domain-containing protein [Deltaproteobacteria bacterium]